MSAVARNDPEPLPVAILFCDVENSVAHGSRDSARYVRLWGELLEGILGTDLPGHEGRKVRSTGDGFLATFPAAEQATRCAIAVQRRVTERQRGDPEEAQLHLRIGLHWGPVTEALGDLQGHDVNLTARIMGLAEGGEVVVSGALRDAVGQAFPVEFEDLGERIMKGLPGSIRAFRLLLDRAVGQRRRAGSAPAGAPSIAVLPFANLSAGKSQDWLADGIVEDIVTFLSRVPDLFVISRLTTLQFRDRSFQPRDIGAALNVRYVVSGSVRRERRRIRVVAELTDTRTGLLRWSDRFDVALAEVFTMQEQIALAIARHVAPYVREIELQVARTQRPDSLEAYHLMLRGVDDMHSCERARFLSARAALEAAIERDRRYALPHAWLAKWHLFRVGQGWSENVLEDAAAGDRCAEAALSLDGADPVALAVHGHVAAYLRRDFDLALDRFGKALMINPNGPLAWMWSAATFCYLGDGAEAVRRAERAIALTPFDPMFFYLSSVAALAHLTAGDLPAAIQRGRESLRANRNFSANLRVLAIALSLSGDREEAERVVRLLIEVEPAFRLEQFRKRFPAATPAMLQRYTDALAAAGLPD